MKTFDVEQAITFKCENCGDEVSFNPGMITLGCQKPACAKKRITFTKDVERRPDIHAVWQKCPAGVSMDVGFTNGTVFSRLYEVRFPVPEEVTEKVAEEKTEQVEEFVEKKAEEVAEEKPAVPKKTKRDNPFYGRLKKPPVKE